MTTSSLALMMGVERAHARAHAFEGVGTVVGRSLGDRTLDIQRLGQGFSVAVRIQQLVDTTRHDLGFLAAVRRGLMSLPTDRRPTPPTRVFPPLEPLEVPVLAGRRIGLIATGGSGVLASVVGAIRALEEAGLRPDVLSLCSGSALFGFPIAAGLTAEDAAAATARLHPPDYVQLSAAPLARSLVSAGRGFGGFLRGERIEAIYREVLGERRLGDLEIPAYVVVWNVERDRLEYLGPRTRPVLPVATAVRLAISLPLMIEGAELDGEHCPRAPGPADRASPGLVADLRRDRLHQAIGNDPAPHHCRLRGRHPGRPCRRRDPRRARARVAGTPHRTRRGAGRTQP